MTQAPSGAARAYSLLLLYSALVLAAVGILLAAYGVATLESPAQQLSIGVNASALALLALRSRS